MHAHRIRVIGGRLRGSRIEVPDAPGLRPTPDRIRETLFNWLAPVIVGSHCLDLYAGTGALGIEALSRGAARVTLVEHSPRVVAQLRSNVERLKLAQEPLRIVARDALDFLRDAQTPDFSLVFLDPPFDLNLWESSAAALQEGEKIRVGGYIYVESPRGHALRLPDSWAAWREAHAGQVRYALYQRVS